MKVSRLKKIINECYQEVLQELDSDDTGVMKIAATDPQKQQKVQQAKQGNQSYEVYDNTTLEETETDFANDSELAEMARIPLVYKLEPGWEEALEANEKLKKSKTIQGIINYLKSKPEGASILDVAKNAFDEPKRQQQLNPLFPALVDAGLVQNAGLRSEPKKPTQKKDKETSFDDAGEELFGGDNDGDAEDFAVGYADKYGHVPASDSDEILPDESPVTTPDEDNDEFKFDGPEEVPNSGNEDEEELERLTNIKDDLLAQYRGGQISLGDYKEKIGDIPSRIKDLKARIEKNINPSLGDEDLEEVKMRMFEGKKRLMKLAGLLKG